MNRFFCAVSLLAVAVLSPVAAQNQPYIPPVDNGTQLFRGLFDFHGITPVTKDKVGTAGTSPDNIVVIYGTPRNLNLNVVNAAKRALQNGGSVLIVSESKYDLSAFFPSGGAAEVSGFFAAFQGPNGPPTATFSVSPVPSIPGEDRVFNRPEMELFSQFERVQVRQSSYLTISTRPPELARNIALFPAGTSVGSAAGLVDATRRHVFAAAGVGTNRNNPFRCVAVADTDLFSNRLMYGSAHPTNPNDNLKFANNLVQWLKGPEERTKCLFVVDGIVIERFDEVKYSAIPLDQQMPDAPMPPLPDFKEMLFDRENQRKIADMGNEFVAEIQEDDRLNRPWTSNRNTRAGFYLGCCVVAAVFLYLLLRFRSLGQRFLALFRPIPKDPHRLGPDTTVGSLEHRRLELLRGGNYSGPVRSYVRELFEERGLPRGYDDDRLPPIEFDVRNPDFLRKSVRTLWAEVCSTKAVTYGRWKELEPMLAAVRAAADDDRWWFTTDEGAA